MKKRGNEFDTASERASMNEQKALFDEWTTGVRPWRLGFEEM
jgi:hypothetical protein